MLTVRPADVTVEFRGLSEPLSLPWIFWVRVRSVDGGVVLMFEFGVNVKAGKSVRVVHSGGQHPSATVLEVVLVSLTQIVVDQIVGARPVDVIFGVTGVVQFVLVVEPDVAVEAFRGAEEKGPWFSSALAIRTESWGAGVGAGVSRATALWKRFPVLPMTMRSGLAVAPITDSLSVPSGPMMMVTWPGCSLTASVMTGRGKPPSEGVVVADWE